MRNAIALLVAGSAVVAYFALRGEPTRSAPAAASLAQTGLVEEIPASQLERLLDLVPPDAVKYAVIRHPVALLTAIQKGPLLLESEQSAAGPPAQPDFARLAEVVAQTGFELTRGVLLCWRAEHDDIVLLFSAAEESTLTRVAEAFGTPSRLPASCRPVAGADGVISCESKGPSYRPGNRGGRLRAQLEAGLPGIRLSRVPYFAHLEPASSGAVGFYIPPDSALLRIFKMRPE